MSQYNDEFLSEDSRLVLRLEDDEQTNNPGVIIYSIVYEQNSLGEFKEMNLMERRLKRLTNYFLKKVKINNVEML